MSRDKCYRCGHEYGQHTHYTESTHCAACGMDRCRQYMGSPIPAWVPRMFMAFLILVIVYALWSVIL